MDKNSLSETQTRDSIFLRIAIDRLRPRTTAELLVYHYMQAKGSTPLAAEVRHNEISPKNILHLRNHRELSTMIETMKCQSQHKR